MADGAVGAVRPAALAEGTLVEVRELFFNVPARRRFLRSEATEATHVLRMVVERLRLSRSDIALRYTSNGREQLRIAPALDGRWREAATGAGAGRGLRRGA